MEIQTHAIDVDGMRLNISDVRTSDTMIHMREQVFGHDEYKIRDMNFQEGDVVIDIGANVGCVSIWLAKKFKFLKIYSFEAHPTNFSNLIKNINDNGVTNVIAKNLAVSSEDDKLVEITLNPRNTGSSSIFKVDSNSQNTAKVKTITLDSIIKNNNISKIRFLKLDCEGSEFDILKNSKFIHQIPIDYVAVEIHTFVSQFNNNNPDDLIELVRSVSTQEPICKVYTLG